MARESLKESHGLVSSGLLLARVGIIGALIPLLGIGAVILGVVGAIAAVIGMRGTARSDARATMARTAVALGGASLLVGIGVNAVFLRGMNESVLEFAAGSLATTAVPCEGTARTAGSGEGHDAGRGAGDVDAGAAAIGAQAAPAANAPLAVVEKPSGDDDSLWWCLVAFDAPEPDISFTGSSDVAMDAAVEIVGVNSVILDASANVFQVVPGHGVLSDGVAVTEELDIAELCARLRRE